MSSQNRTKEDEGKKKKLEISSDCSPLFLNVWIATCKAITTLGEKEREKKRESLKMSLFFFPDKCLTHGKFEIMDIKTVSPNSASLFSEHEYGNSSSTSRMCTTEKKELNKCSFITTHTDKDTSPPMMYIKGHVMNPLGRTHP